MNIFDLWIWVATPVVALVLVRLLLFSCDWPGVGNPPSTPSNTMTLTVNASYTTPGPVEGKTVVAVDTANQYGPSFWEIDGMTRDLGTVSEANNLEFGTTYTPAQKPAGETHWVRCTLTFITDDDNPHTLVSEPPHSPGENNNAPDPTYFSWGSGANPKVDASLERTLDFVTEGPENWHLIVSITPF